MKKIIIFSGFILPHLGGVERYTDKIVSELVKKNIYVTIVTSNYLNEKIYEKKEGYEIYRLPIYNLFKNRYPIIKKNKVFYEIMDKILEKPYDSVICQTRFYSIVQVGIKFAKKKDLIPIIIDHSSNHISVNNKILDFFGSVYEHFLTYKIKKSNARFFGVSKKSNEWLKHFKINASGVLYNSVDKKSFMKYHKEQRKNKKIKITYVGRIIKEKGICLLLDAFCKLNKSNKYIELFIAGDGPLLDQCKKKYDNKDIHFLGLLNHERVMDLLDETDIFVHPSMYPEGLPTGILEAGIMKCAVIATDKGGTIEVISSNKYGLIMEESDNSLFENLKYLVDNKDKVEELKNNLYKKVKKEFTWEVTVENLLSEIYKK